MESTVDLLFISQFCFLRDLSQDDVAVPIHVRCYHFSYLCTISGYLYGNPRVLPSDMTIKISLSYRNFIT